MAFNKTGISVTPPTPVELSPEIGEVREDGMIWDGEKWVLEMDELQEAAPREPVCSLCGYPRSQQQCSHCSEG